MGRPQQGSLFSGAAAIPMTTSSAMALPQKQAPLQPRQVPPGEVFRPHRRYLEHLEPVDFLGKAKVWCGLLGWMQWLLRWAPCCGIGTCESRPDHLEVSWAVWGDSPREGPGGMPSCQGPSRGAIPSPCISKCLVSAAGCEGLVETLAI